MEHRCIFNASEHDVSIDIPEEVIPEEFASEINRDYIKKKKLKTKQNFTYLGINSSDRYDENTGEFKDSVLRANYFIGYRWFEKNESYVHVSQKVHNNKQADFMKMFLTCLKDPVVSKTIIYEPEKLYKIFFDEPMIEIKDKKDEITPFLILHFLELVKNVTRKGLKKGYIRVTENLTSKIKGKILINQTIKQNHLKNRLDKTVCNHQIFTINCLENQIIKTALMQCGKYLQNIKDETIYKTLRQNISAFELVDTKEVFSSDFSKIKHSPFYKEYKEALSLAKMIFKRFGFALNNSSTNTQVNKIPPYYINMPELFERYVEVKLREAGYDIINGNKKGESIAHWSMRPDFLLPKMDTNQMAIIIDAKYKYWFGVGKDGENSEHADYKQDYMQLSLYGRDLRIRKSLCLKENIDNEIDLLFIYPILNDKYKEMLDLNSPRRRISSKFSKVNRIELSIPFKQT